MDEDLMDPDIVLSGQHFKELVESGVTNVGGTVILVPEHQWLPVIVKLKNA